MNRYEIRTATNATRPEDRGELLAYAQTWAEATAIRDAHIAMGQDAFISRIQAAETKAFNADMWVA
jgi:hypothetical protein